jgi:hypothetical protein
MRRQHTPGEFRAIGSDASTNPAPPADDLQAKIAEVMGALAQFGALATELQVMFGSVRLAQLAGEHRLNVHRAKINANRMFLGDHERRLREAERLGLALRAELVAERAEREAMRTEIDDLKATAAE